LFNELLSIISNPVLIIILLTLLPFLELRASIPYGILIANMDWWFVFLLAVVTNILLAPLLYFFLDKIIHLFFFIKPFGRWYHRKIESTQKRIKPYVQKYGVPGIGLFIGIPLPGTGVYTGALGSYVLNLGYRRFIYASIIGVLIAGTIVLLVSMTLDSGSSLLSGIFLKQI